MSLQLAEQYEENEQYDKAYEEYKRLHAKNPDDLSLLERLGHTAMVLDKKDEAAEYYSKIIERVFDLKLHTCLDVADKYKTNDKKKLNVFQEFIIPQLEFGKKREVSIQDFINAINAFFENDAKIKKLIERKRQYKDEILRQIHALDDDLRILMRKEQALILSKRKEKICDNISIGNLWLNKLGRYLMLRKELITGLFGIGLLNSSDNGLGGEKWKKMLNFRS